MSDLTQIRCDRLKQIKAYLRQQAKNGDRQAEKLLLGLAIDDAQREYVADLSGRFDGLFAEMGIERITAS
ncbi:MAG: hypothetical protein NZ772_14725 [Cyanobacteria bacterium]|nr:hypothetical protein [Cyanobacteriota bacterium]MDW8202626.1 hypothetical protein [Cyanobacteriota bacterium SKYGB_h_bin112]